MKFVRSLHDIVAHLFHPRRSNNHRPRVLHPEALLILFLLVGGVFGSFRLLSKLPPSMAGVLGFASNITPGQVIEATNAERAQQGLPALTYNDKLSQAAIAKAQDMFSDQYWAHTAPDGTEPWAFIRNAGYSYQVAGENLARDFGDTPGMMAAWMASPTHRANIVNSKYKEIGIGVVDGVLQGYETTLVVQMFGTPSQGSAAVPETAAVQTRPAPAQPIASVVPSPASIEENEETTPSAVAEVEPVLPRPTATVLASMLVPLGSIERPPLFTPLQLTKAFFLAVIVMIVCTLMYDTLIIGHRRTVRVVGKNLGHIALFLAVAYLVIFFKGGIVG
jgi:hypothetical protein